MRREVDARLLKFRAERARIGIARLDAIGDQHDRGLVLRVSQIFGRLAHGQHDPAICPAPADVTFHRTDDVPWGGIRILAKQGRARHDHPRRAVATLHGPNLQKGLLERVELAVALQPFDGGDLRAGAVAHERETRPPGLAVDEYGAGPALPFATAVLAARQVQVVPQDAQQRPLGVGLQTALAPVHHHFDSSHSRPLQS